MKRLLVALSALGLTTVGLLPSSTAHAQQIVGNPTGVLSDVSFATVDPVLREMGFQTSIVTVGNENIMRVATPQGRILAMRQKACSQSGCAGLWMSALVNGSANLDTINQFNTVSKPARAALHGEQIWLDRYLIADYGISRGTFAVNTMVMIGMIDQWARFNATSAPIAVSFTPLIGPAPEQSDIGHDINEDLRINIGRDPAFLNDVSRLDDRLN